MTIRTTLRCVMIRTERPAAALSHPDWVLCGPPGSVFGAGTRFFPFPLARRECSSFRWVTALKCDSVRRLCPKPPTRGQPRLAIDA